MKINGAVCKKNIKKFGRLHKSACSYQKHNLFTNSFSETTKRGELQDSSKKNHNLKCMVILAFSYCKTAEKRKVSNSHI